MSTIQDMINSLAQGNTEKATEEFNTIFSEKAATALEKYKETVGQNFFGSDVKEARDDERHDLDTEKRPYDQKPASRGMSAYDADNYGKKPGADDEGKKRLAAIYAMPGLKSKSMTPGK